MSTVPSKNEPPEAVDSAPDASSCDPETAKPAPANPTFQRGPRFWAIIATLCVMGILSSLENTVVTTSLPFIVDELELGENYIWVNNVFFLTSAAIQPLFGQLANIFGRRYVTLAIVALFTLGSGIAGGATNGATLIAGRALQGMGGGGINMIIDVIVSDLVPLRERGNYMAYVLGVYFVGLAIGPYVGGAIIENTTWRWVFYINLPFGALSLLMILLFLHVTHNKNTTITQKLKRIDYPGNTLLIASTVSILYALTYASTRYPWPSYRILVPLLLGLAGLVSFVYLESRPFITEPVVPPRLFSNRTSAIIFFVTFLNAMLLYWVLFFLPVYFQAVLLSSPSRSGVQLLPVIIIFVPVAIIAVLLLAKFGKYKPLHVFGFGVSTLGIGLFALLDKNTTTAEWVVFEIIAAGGSGFVLNTLLPACQAPLEEKDQAAATATWSFVRSFGAIWGVAIPAAIFNNYIERNVGMVGDEGVRGLLLGGDAYGLATAAWVGSLEEVVREQVRDLYTGALRQLWLVGIAFSAASFLAVFGERQIKMRTELETEFGLEEK
ncbi:hypothetical protein OQA88_11028 [Cercophora sp. LCS_1]